MAGQRSWVVSAIGPPTVLRVGRWSQSGRCRPTMPSRGSATFRAVNLAVWVERHGRRRPDDPALADGERVHATWRQFAQRAAHAAAGFRADLGLEPGDRVAIVMRNRPEYLEALYGIWHAGLVAVPVNARLHRDEIAYIVA